MEKVIKHIVIIMIIAVSIIASTNNAFAAQFNREDYRAKDLDDKSSWKDVEVLRYSKTNSKKPSEAEILQNFADNSSAKGDVSKLKDFQKEGAIQFANDEYARAVETEIATMYKLLIVDVKRNKIKDLSSEDLKQYLDSLENYSKNPAFSIMSENAQTSGNASAYALEITDRINYIKKDLKDKLTEDQQQQVNQITSTVVNTVQNDQEQIHNQAVTEPGTNTSSNKIQDWPTSISGIVVMGNSKKDNGEDILDPTENPDSYKPTGTSEDAERLVEIGGAIIGVLRVVGVVVAVITLSIIGLKYMMGSTSDKAEYKKTMIPFLIGAGLLLIGTQLVGVLYDLITLNNG